MGIQTKGFVEQQAEAYRAAAAGPSCREPWDQYRREVVANWLALGAIRIEQVAHFELLPGSLRTLQQDCLNGVVKTWSGGDFSPDHPMRSYEPAGHFNTLHAYVIARALHDYTAHYLWGFTFSLEDELRAAFMAHEFYFSDAAAPAQWTDDVAMSCYRAHYGEWPRRQRPIIVKPDWQGLLNFLEGRAA